MGLLRAASDTGNQRLLCRLFILTAVLAASVSRLWQKPYEALARECGLSGQVEDAFDVLGIFLKPILGS
jgi:hypothetical protein